jgi:hypothetical protein
LEFIVIIALYVNLTLQTYRWEFLFINY